MHIHHEPIFLLEKLIDYYTKKDGCEIRYVCTSDIFSDDMPADVFYRATPHPEFGNRYFGVYRHPFDDKGIMICNADIVENMEFAMVNDGTDRWHYSQSRHDYRSFENGAMIDGGRNYTRTSVSRSPNDYRVMRIHNGNFVANDLVDWVAIGADELDDGTTG